MKKEFTIGKYKIETDERGRNGQLVYTVLVLNTNARLYNQIVHNYYFTTIEKREAWIVGFVNSIKDYEQLKAKRKEERKAKPRNTQLTSVVKDALASKYGYKNVRVSRGSGTAYGWVEALITLPYKKPVCDYCQKSTYGRCDTCSGKYTEKRLEAERIAHKAVKDAGLSFGVYYDDMTSDPHSEFMLQIEYEK